MSITQSSMGVEYRLILGFPGYRVGDDGSVWSRWIRRMRQMDDLWRRLIPGTCQHYPQVGLYRDGKRYGRTVHSLVLEAFIGPCPPGMMGLHRDDNPVNNKLGNLYYGTPRQNGQDAVRNGRTLKGAANRKAKLDDSLIIEIRQAYHAGGVTQVELAALFGIAQTMICRIVRGEVWGHVGGPITLCGKGRNNPL